MNKQPTNADTTAPPVGREQKRSTSFAGRTFRFVRRHPFVSWFVVWACILFVPWTDVWSRIVAELPESVPSGFYRLTTEPEDEWTGYPCFSLADRDCPIRIEFTKESAPLFSYRRQDGKVVRRNPAFGQDGGRWRFRCGVFVFEERLLGPSYMALCLGLAQKRNTTTIEPVDSSTLRVTTRRGERGLLLFLVPWWESFSSSCDLERIPDEEARKFVPLFNGVEHRSAFDYMELLKH